ncbi:MAG: pilus assembly protein [Coriobacteriaceae bacterium]|nr:pilus assembly protein [Coriobacteriaceae bacterium]
MRPMRGQAGVEMLLCLPFILALTFVLADCTVMFSCQLKLNAAIAESARWANAAKETDEGAIGAHAREDAKRACAVEDVEVDVSLKRGEKRYTASVPGTNKSVAAKTSMWNGHIKATARPKTFASTFGLPAPALKSDAPVSITIEEAVK